jgi:hypothetical protein
MDDHKKVAWFINLEYDNVSLDGGTDDEDFVHSELF